MKNQEFLNYIFGGITPITYLASFIFLFMGLIILWSVRMKKAIVNNPNTPYEFNLAYWVKHNLFTKLFSIFANTIIGFIALRFSAEIFNVKLSMFFAFCIGLAFDKVIEMISNWQSNLKIKE